MKITAADCGEDIMSQRLAQKITGEIPPTVIEIISRGRLEWLIRKKIVVKSFSREKKEVFFGAKNEPGFISESLFSCIAGKQLYCFVDNGIIYIQLDTDGHTKEVAVPWFAVKALIFGDDSSL